MESKDELKEIDDIKRVWIDFSDILLDEKLYKGKDENILICDT